MPALKKTKAVSDFYLLEDEISADYIKHVLNIALQQGLEIAPLLKQAELTFNPLAPEFQHIEKLPTRHYEKLCRSMQHQLKAFSYSDTRLVDSFEILCHCIETAETLGDAITRTEKYINLTHINGQPMRCLQQQDRFCFSYIHIASDWNVNPQQLDTHILFFWHRLFCWLIDEYITLDEVRVCSSALSNRSNADSLFHCPVIFNSTENSLLFSSHYLDKPISRSWSEFSELLHRSEFNFFLITNSQVMPVAEQVRLLLDQNFPQQFPPLEVIAEKLHMSASSLRRRLKRESTSYQGIKDRTHKQRATSLLQRQDLSINEIAEKMGFNDSSSFQRAFKRWAGETPGSFRLRLQQP